MKRNGNMTVSVSYRNHVKFLFPLLLAGGILASSVTASAQLLRAKFGRMSGTVTDSQGKPLVGATVMIVGPIGGWPAWGEATAEKVVTDVHGKYSAEHLSPGQYSVRVTSPTLLSAFQNRIRVKPGRTAKQTIVLGDVLSSLHLQIPSRKHSSWENDWKWVLRTSSSTRLILRYRETDRGKEVASSGFRAPRPHAQRLVGLVPSFMAGSPISNNTGMGPVAGYLHPFSTDSDIFMAGSMGANGPQGASLVVSYRRHLLSDHPQQLSVVMRQFDFTGGTQVTGEPTHPSMAAIRAAVVRYTGSRHLSNALTITTGLEIDYLDASRDFIDAHPHVKLVYRLNPSTTLLLRYGNIDAGHWNTMIQRIQMLSAVPEVTLRNSHPRMEGLNHSEIGVERRLSKNSILKLAAFHDSFQDAAVWGFGSVADSGFDLSGNVLRDPSIGGVVLNAGNYKSSGMRASYSVGIGRRVKADLAYVYGDALTVDEVHLAGGDTQQFGRQLTMHPVRSQSFEGRVVARIPRFNTQVTASYETLQQGRLTGVDPFGEAELQIRPFLGVQVRQPLPTIAFLPARIEALAEFSNLLGQGYVPLSRSGEKPFLLSPSYRSVEGGFSVQF